MGYDLFITRAEFWPENEGREITAEEWVKLVEADQELKLAGYNGPYFALWDGPSKYPEAWLDWDNGNIYSKNPDKAIVAKMIQIAGRLGARVQGQDGEIYLDTSQVSDPDDPLPPIEIERSGQRWWRRMFRAR
ncbi:MAG: hypothetical protein AABO57_23835 [Acidobacteriota bacterium]